MAEFNDNSHKGMVLMQQALKKYAEGDFESGDKDRDEANRYFDLASAEMNSEEGKISQLYGESRNFGLVYQVFEENLIDLLKRKDGKQIIKEFYDTIRKNKVLNEQFKVYDAFENFDNNDDVEHIISEATELIKRLDKKSVMENNNKLIDLIRKYNLNEYVEIPEEKENLYEAIEYIMLNKKSFNNIGNFIKSEKIITEHIKNKQKKQISEQLDFDMFKDKIEESGKEFDLNEEEKKLFQDYMNPKINNKELFENIKNETLKLLGETIEKSDESDRESWKTVNEDVKNMTYNEADCFTQCAKLMEIKETL
jgi:hypothetical protein